MRTMLSGTNCFFCSLLLLAACSPDQESPGAPEPSSPEAAAASEPNREAATTSSGADVPGSPSRRLRRLPVVRVTNPDQLVDALEGGVRIELAGGTYDLSGRSVVLQDLTDLVLEGPGPEGAEPAVLWSSTCDEPLLSFAECENIELRGLTLSRAREGEGADGTCTAPLIAVRAGYRLTLEDCVLTGGGTAAAVTRSNAFYLVGVTVTGCARALEVRNSKHLGLEHTVFRENAGASLFSFRGRDTRHISFTACKIDSNELGDAGAIFDLDATSLPIDLIDCVVTGNTAGGLATGPGAQRITLSRCRVQGF